MTTRRSNSIRKRLSFTALILLVIIHLVVNWLYISTNVTILGVDVPAHLESTLVYNRILSHVDLKALFRALTWSWNRPPLPFLTAVLFYRLFGVSTDSALMSNSPYLIVLLFSVYGIGRRVYNRPVGLLAAFLVSTYPILFNLSRTFYPDFALTALVALSIYFLMGVERFHNRKYSLLLGLTLGLGMLSKWPFAAFVGASLLYVIIRSRGGLDIRLSVGIEAETSSPLHRILICPGVHIMAGFLLAAIWYLPNWDQLSGFLLGIWLFPLLGVLLAATFYILSRRPSPGTNLLSALLLGALVASLWSLPNLGFVRRFFVIGYSGVNVAGKPFSFRDPAIYLRYLRLMMTAQLSPLYFGAFIVAIFVLVYLRLKGSSMRRAVEISDHAWIIFLWFTVPLLVFTLSRTINVRFDVPLLPSAALITARGFWEVKRRWIRVVLISTLITVGMVQFLALSFDGLGWLQEVARFDLPMLGEGSLFAQGKLILLPNSGVTDSRFWIEPDILELVRADMEVEDREEERIAVLGERRYLNVLLLEYVRRLYQYPIEACGLAKGSETQPANPRLFEYDYVVRPVSLDEETDRERDPLFDAVFDLMKRYDLPNGDRVYIYKKRSVSGQLLLVTTPVVNRGKPGISRGIKG